MSNRSPRRLFLPSRQRGIRERRQVKDKTRQNKEREDMRREDRRWQNKTWQGKGRQEKTKDDKTKEKKQDNWRQDKTAQNKNVSLYSHKSFALLRLWEASYCHIILFISRSVKESLPCWLYLLAIIKHTIHLLGRCSKTK